MALSVPDVFISPHRDTPAGKALFKLYNGNQAGKSAGTAFHQRNKQQHDKKLATGWAPPSLEPTKPEIQRPKVNYPSFGHYRPGEDEMNAARLRRIPHRKPGSEILKELQEEAEERRRAPPPMPKGPLLDAAEKDRLAEMMRWHGKPPEKPTPEQQEEARRHRGVRDKPKSEREEVQQMFDQVMQEVEERQEFLADLQAAGGLKEDHINQVRLEIAVRIQDMQRLDRMLKAMDAGGE